ncbi:conserved hypothetical protein [Tenacibaculum dicentrarchi]|nr:conserved hypothetical protein [Tenacibaculum dicentrarchi]
MKTYPQILIPNEVISIKNLTPKIPSPPEKPKFPERKIPKKPIEVDKGSGIGNAFIILLILFGGGGILASIKIDLGGIMILLGIYLGFYWIFKWNKIQNERERDYNKYKSELQEYNYLKNNSEKIYQNEIQSYKNSILPKYSKEFEKYNTLISNIKSDRYLSNFRNKKLIKYFENSTKPKKINLKYTKGVSEDYFLLYLNKYFKDIVYTNNCIYDENFNGIPYNPDFLIIEPELNIHIDIEIDEPYIGKNGKPIHFIDGNDNYRNDFFLKNRWIIIRFAEVQIIKYPKLCCEIIQSTINAIKSTNGFNENKIKQKIENFNCWNKDEANRLAYTRFRNKYLPNDLIEILNTEEMELENKFLNSKVVNKNVLPF